jgi:hypothetical protein
MLLKRPAGVLMAILAVVAVVPLYGVADEMFAAAHYTNCDNMLGECLRYRQQWALSGIGLAGVLLIALSAATALGGLIKGFRWWQPVVLVVALALIVGVQLIDPVSHLDDRWRGWLSDT